LQISVNFLAPGPNTHSQYGSGFKRAKSMRIHKTNFKLYGSVAVLQIRGSGNHARLYVELWILMRISHCLKNSLPTLQVIHNGSFLYQKWYRNLLNTVPVLRIRIRMFLGLPDPLSEVRIRLRILLSSSKKCKKNLSSYCFAPSLRLFIFEKRCKCTFKKMVFSWCLEGQ